MRISNSKNDDVASLAGDYCSLIIRVSQLSSTTRNLVPRFKGWSKGDKLGKDEVQHKIGTWGYLSERGIEAPLELKFKKVIESKVRRCHKTLQSGRQFRCLKQSVKGVQCIENKIISRTVACDNTQSQE